MSYRTETSARVQAQLLTMPQAARDAYRELLKRAAEDPWDAPPWRDGPQVNMRQAAFGDGQGIAVYVVLDRDERVVVVDLVWLT